MKVQFTLVQPAKKSGGDKYAAAGREDFNIYVPQDISRAHGQPAKFLVVAIEEGAVVAETL